MKTFTNQSKHLPDVSNASAHNVYSVNRYTQHYIQCSPEPEETLLDRVLGYGAFALFMLLMAFL